MTTPATSRKAGPLLGNDAQTAWPFTFKVFAESDIAVTIADSAGVETPLVLDTDYTVALNANQETSPGGTVTYPISGSPLATGSVLAIVGNLDYSQPLDLPSGGNFSPLALENQLDRTAMQIQQLDEEMSRTAKLPVTSAADADSLVADIVLLADNTADINTVADNIASVNAVAADAVDIGLVAGSIANVNLVGNSIADVNNVAASLADVSTVAGSIASVNAVAAVDAEVTAVAAVAAETAAVAGIAADVVTVAANVADVTNFADVYQGAKASDPALRNDGSALQAGDLYFNTVESALRAYSGTLWVAGTAGTVSVNKFSGDAVETVFLLPTAPASKNNTQVYIGGVYQQKEQYSVSGVEINFTSPPPVGTDNIEVVTIATLALGETDATLVSATDPRGSARWADVQGFIDQSDASRAELSPLDFGVAVTDATVQLALTHVKTNGGTLRLPKGDFSVTALVLSAASAPFAIKGAGRSQTILRRASDAVGTMIAGTAIGHKCVLEDFSIHCEHSIYPNGSHGISISDTNGVRVRRVDIYDYKNSAILFFGNTANTYYDCIAEDCTSNGLDVANNGMLCADIDRSGFINCQALNVGKTGSPCYGLQMKNGCQDGFIVNGYTNGATIGFALGNYDPGGTHKNNRIIGGKAFDCDVGIAFGKALGDYVQGLVIDMNNTGQNAVDFNLNSVGNTVRGVAVKNLAAAKEAVRFRAGDTDNVCEVDSIENSSGVAGTRIQFLTGSLRNYVSLNRFVNPNNVTDSSTLSADSGSSTTITAGSFVTGTTYNIASLGTTDFTLIGAGTNTPGTNFVATGAGTGTGTAFVATGNVFEYKGFTNKQTSVIAGGIISIRHGKITRVTLDTEGGAATDDLTTICKGVEGQIITLSQSNNSRDITYKHNAGNIKLTGASDFASLSAGYTLTLCYSSALNAWVEVSRGTAS